VVFIQRNNAWIFLSEVGFNAAPEPEVYAMLLAGSGLLGFVAKRNKQKFNECDLIKLLRFNQPRRPSEGLIFW